jgi:hypothetical protein
MGIKCRIRSTSRSSYSAGVKSSSIEELRNQKCLAAGLGLDEPFC